jgi:predicted DNA-binding protein
MLSVPLTTKIQQRLGELAKSRGQSDAEFARELIEASIEELDDVQMVTIRLESRQPALNSDQARKALGAGRLSKTAAF